VEKVGALSLQAEFKVQKEAVWTVANFTTGASVEQLFQLVHAGVLGPLMDLLTVPDVRIVVIILDVVACVLQVRHPGRGSCVDGSLQWKTLGSVLKSQIGFSFCPPATFLPWGQHTRASPKDTCLHFLK
jgi:hypothetical protein